MLSPGSPGSLSPRALSPPATQLLSSGVNTGGETHICAVAGKKKTKWLKNK